MRKQRRQRKIEIFKLEDRVLFEAAGAAEAVEAADHANNPNPDQQHDISESERQEKEAQSAVKHVGPGTALPDPGAAVQDQGAGLAQPGTAHQDPAQKLVDGSADFSNVPDVTEHHSSDVSDFLNADFSDHSAAQLSFSDSLSADGHDLIIVDADAAKDLDLNSLPDNTEVLVLDHNSDAMEQINAYLDSRDGKFDSVKFVVDADPSGADSAQEHLELNGKDVSDADLNAIRDHVAEHGDLSVHTALDDSAPSYSLNPDGDFEHSADGDLHDTVIHPEIDKNITVNTDPADQIDPALANPVEDGRNELVIIDSNMADKDTVLSQIGEGRDVLEIDPTQDAMSQIQDYLDAHSDTKYDAVHIMTHGNDLGFYLGSTKVTTADQMSVFNGHMAENGDFMLYGCELASNEHGQSLIQDIADFTGCDVAASTNTTGISGDWALEYNVGVIETANISIHGWEHDLATITLTVDGVGSGVNKYATLDEALAVANGDTAGNIYIVVLDKDGATHTITNGTYKNVERITVTAEDILALDNGADVTIENGTFVVEEKGTLNIIDNVTLSVKNTIVIAYGGNATLNGTISIESAGNVAISNTGELNITGDVTFTHTASAGDSAISNSGKLTISYSKINVSGYSYSVLNTSVASNKNTVSATFTNAELGAGIQSAGSVENTLTDVTLTGDLTNKGSNFYITGTFKSADNSPINITNENVDATGIYGETGGNIYFGEYDVGGESSGTSIEFNEDQQYSFRNNGGTVSIYNFTGLSSEANPVTIWNKGIFLIDPNRTDQTAATLWVTGTTVNNSYNSGIYNTNTEGRKYRDHHMILTDLHIRNTQAKSIGVTNYAGTLYMERGSIQAGYAGFANLVHISDSGSTSPVITIYMPYAKMIDVETVAGRAYSIINSGTLEQSNSNNSLLLTNHLDIIPADSYNGDYVAFANRSVTFALREYYESTTNYWNQWWGKFTTGFQDFSFSGNFGRQSASALLPGNLTVQTQDSLSLSTERITIETADDSWSGTNPTSTTWLYQVYGAEVDARLSNVAFFAEGSNSATALQNWGNLTVDDIDISRYSVTDFSTILDNGRTSFLIGLYYNPITTTIYQARFSVRANIEVGFTFTASQIKAGNFDRTTTSGLSLIDGDTILRGTDTEGTAKMLVEGAPYIIYERQTLSLINVTVEGAKGSEALRNQGTLYIGNGAVKETVYWSDTNTWLDIAKASYDEAKGKSQAYIKADEGTAIVNDSGALFLINAAIKDSVVGVDNDAYMAVMNSTFYNNKIGIRSISTSSSANTTPLLIGNTTIYSNKADSVGVQLDGGKMSIANSIVLVAGGVGINNNNGTIDSDVGNIIGQDAQDTETKVAQVYGVFPVWDNTYNVLSLKDGSTALTGGVALGYTISENNFMLYINDVTKADIVVTWDKLGNDRTTEIGSYVKTGGVTPPSPTSDIIVNTVDDYAGTITKELIENKIKNEDSKYSLREVIWAIQNGYLESGDVQFDWDALIVDGGNTNITIEVKYGSIDITDNISITIDLTKQEQLVPVGVTLTINASGNGESAFVVNGSSLSLGGEKNNNLTLIGATTAGNGGAIDIEAGIVNLTNVDIKDGSAALGGAIYLASGSAFLTASGTTFSNNTASSGGAIYNNGGQVTFSGGGNSFSNNQAGNGGAIYNNRGTLSLGGVSFSGNSATVGNGGAIYTVGGTIDMGGTSFSGNSATGNGGAIYNNGSSLSVADGGVFTGNHATENGGAIYNDGNGSLTIQGGEFSGNYTDSGDGGVIYNGSGALDIQGGKFSDNHAAGNGGVIYNGSGALTIQSGEFSGNYAGGDGGVVYNASGAGAMNVAGGVFAGNYAGGNGGAVYNASAEGMTVFAAFGGNHAANGGAIYNTAGILNVGGMFIGNYAETGDGGAIYNESAAGMTVAADFTDNNAANGGAIYNKNGTLAISGGSFEANEARNGNGGAIYHGGAGSLMIDGTRLIGNSAAVQGGAVFSGNGALNVKNSTFTGNMAVAGAAIFSGGFATMDRVVFSGNQASESIVTINGGDLKNLTVSDNTAGSGALFDSLGSKTVIDLSAFYDNNAEILLSAGATLYVINSTFAEGNGDVTKHMITGGDVTILNTTVTGDMADRGDALIDAGTIRSVNNIIVGTDASQTALNGSKVEAAYTIMSGTGTQVHGGVDDSNVFGINYRALFGGNTVDPATGTIALLSGSIAETGVWVGYNTENGDLYYSVRPDQLYPRYGIDKVDWKKFGSDTLIARPDNVKITEGLNGNTLPSIGSYWITQDVPTLGIGPGVNNTFIDPSFNGIGWNNNDIYNVVADSLIMNPGFLLNFRNEMPVGGRWYYDFTHAFDDRYSSYVGRFAVTLGRFDLGFVPSGENYISINVNSHVSDDFTRYTTTPYLSDGTPLIPAELESMNSETTAPATEGSFELPEGLEEKLVSYLGRAEIFKNDFDKALDQLLAVNA